MWIELFLFAVISTATYAWYTITNRIQLDKIEFISDSYGYRPGNLVLGWTGHENPSEFTTDNIKFVADDVLYPSIPKTLPVIGETTWEEFVPNFSTAQERDNKLVYVKDSNGYTLCREDGQSYFWIKNRTENGLYVTVTVSMATGITLGVDTMKKMRAAVFIGEDENSTVLRGIDSYRGRKIHYGELYEGMSVDEVNAIPQSKYWAEDDIKTENNEEINKDFSLVDETGNISFYIAPMSELAVRLVVWFDGVDMHSVDGGLGGRIGFYFLGKTEGQIE